MNRPGIVRSISILAGFVLAAPMAIIGFEFLTQGRTAFGTAFILLAVLLLFLPEFVISRLPRPRQVIRKRLGRFHPGKLWPPKFR